LREAYIETKDLSVNRNGLDILKDINISIYKNCINAIIGPNGAGKTTLLHAILNLCSYKGKITFHGNSKPNIGYIPQKLDFIYNMPITVVEFIALGQQKIPLWMGVSSSVKKKAIGYLERVSATHLKDSPISKLSGGELQRVLLALALVNEPDVVLMDEPISGVDVAGEETFCKLLSELLKERDLGIVLVSHDLSMVTSHADHVICINKTLQCQGGVVEVLTQENIEKIYGISFGLYSHNGLCKACHSGCTASKRC